MRTTRLIITALLLTAASLGSAGQSTPYKFDIGAGLGMSGYIGEANRSSLMKHPGFVGVVTAYAQWLDGRYGRCAALGGAGVI